MIPRYPEKKTGEKRQHHPYLCYTCRHKTIGERCNPSNMVQCIASGKPKEHPAKRDCANYTPIE